MSGRICSGLGVCLLAGCAQLAGIDETSSGGPAGAGVNLTVDRVSIGATVVTSPLDLTALTASWLLPDVSAPGGLLPITATVVPPNTWHADINPATPAVQFTLPDAAQPRMLDLGLANMQTAFTVLEHPNPTPAPEGAMITVNVTLDVPYAGENLQLFAIGPWVARALEAPAAGVTQLAPPAFAYTSMTSQSGRPHEAVTAADPVFVFRYIGNQLAGMLEVTPFDQTGMDTITGMLVSVARDQSLAVTVDQTDVARRFSAVRPAVAATPTMSWSLRAAPGYQYGLDNGPLLDAAAVAATDPPTITAAYGNPFSTRTWNTLLTWSTRATRSYTPPGMTLAATLTAGMFQRNEPSPNLALALPAGLPELITLDGMSLSTDGLTIPQPLRPLEVTFVTDKPGNTLYSVELYELVPNAGGTALRLDRVVTAFAPMPKLALPAEHFKPGSFYTIRAISHAGGYPNLADGDLVTRSLPIATSFLDSGVFQVMP